MAEISHPAKAGSTQANSTEEKRPIYEVGFHLLPALSEEAVTTAAGKVHSALADAEIIAEQFPQKMTLAYTIERSVSGKREKFTESYFGWIKFTAEREAIPALQEKLRAMSDILRYMVIETVREEAAAPRRAVFTSDRLEGQTLKKPTTEKEEKGGEVSEEELDKSIDALVA
jgi:ribosomal protein S6